MYFWQSEGEWGRTHHIDSRRNQMALDVSVTILKARMQ